MNMKKILLITLISVFSFGLLKAQLQENRYTEITNPKLVEMNKEPARASFFSFTSANEALSASNSSRAVIFTAQRDMEV